MGGVDGRRNQAPEVAAKRVLSNVFRMVAREDERVRLHALNLLLNLCVHANMTTASALFSSAKTQQNTTSRLLRGER